MRQFWRRPDGGRTLLGAWRAGLLGLGDDQIARRLNEAARRGHLDRLSELIKAGADVNEADHWGVTALMNANRSGHDACIPVLLEGGAELNRADNNGWTALVYACHWGREACTLALLNAGADTLAVNKRGRTAVQVAAVAAEAQLRVR